MQTANYKQTEIGEIPGDWMVDSMKNHLLIKGRIGWKGLKKSEYLDEGYGIINGLQIQGGFVNWDNVGRITKARFEESPEIILKEKDILMTKDGTIGKLAFIDTLPESSTVASGVFVIRNNSKYLDSAFLYYYLQSGYFHSLVRNRIEGAVIPHLYQRDINELLVPLPPPQEQQLIVSILSSLDGKIELNRKMNRALEEMGKELFKRWFMDFEFPDDDGKPYKSSGGEMVDSNELGEVPRGWEICNLYELSDYINGKAFKIKDFSEGGLPIVKIAELKNGITESTKLTDGNFESKYQLSNKDILFSWSGSPDTSIDCFIWSYGSAWLNQHVFKIVPRNNYSPGFLYFLLKHFMPLFISTAKDKQTTGLGHVTVSDLKRIKIALPAKINNIDIFNILFDEIYFNINNSIVLNSMKDFLLPRLMNGKLRVN